MIVHTCLISNHAYMVYACFCRQWYGTLNAGWSYKCMYMLSHNYYFLNVYTQRVYTLAHTFA